MLRPFQWAKVHLILRWFWSPHWFLNILRTFPNSQSGSWSQESLKCLPLILKVFPLQVFGMCCKRLECMPCSYLNLGIKRMSKNINMGLGWGLQSWIHRHVKMHTPKKNGSLCIWNEIGSQTCFGFITLTWLGLGKSHHFFPYSLLCD